MENESTMEPEQEQELPQESGRQPRPLWQRILAWVCLALFVCMIILYYISMMRGGR